MQSKSDNSIHVPRSSAYALDISVEPALGRLAARQHGLVTLGQLRDLGVSRSAVRTRLVKGQWTSLGPSVLRIDGSPPTWESDLMAHVLGAGDVSMASHRAAAVLWGLDGFAGCRPEITVPRSRNSGRWGDVVVHRSGDLHLVTAVTMSGIPTTPVGRTLLDLGAVVGSARVQQAVDDAREKGLVDWDGLVDTLVMHSRRGRDGIGLLRTILDRNFVEVSQVDGAVERLVFLLLKNANLPPAVLGHELSVRGEVYRLGPCYPDHKVAIELEGDEELSCASARSVHYERLNVLGVAGWSVYRFSQWDYLDRPKDIVRYIRDALSAPAT